MNQDKVKRMVEEFFRGQYEIEKFLGAGGFADVYLAKHRYLDDRRAMKINKEPLISNNAKGIFEEARVATLIRHKNVISIHDAGIISVYGQDKDGFFNFGKKRGKREEKYAYFVMEYAAGGDLWKYWQSFSNHYKLMPIIEVLDIMKQISIGLNVLHSAKPDKIIHRDLKPQNLMVEFDEGKPLIKITDFGLAKETTTTLAEVSVAGTPLFMAPECFNKKFSTMSDIYAVGVIFYQLLTNTFPYNITRYDMGDMFFGKPWKNKLEPPSAYNPEISSDLDQIVVKCLSINPRDRYANAGELLSIIKNYMEKLGINDTSTIYTSQNSSSDNINNKEEVKSDSVEEVLNKAFKLAKKENKLSEAIEILEKAIISDLYIRENYTYRLKLWKDEMPDEKLIEEAFKVYSQNQPDYSLAIELLQEAIAFNPKLKESYEGYLSLWSLLLNLSENNDLKEAVHSLEELINEFSIIKDNYASIINILKTYEINTIVNESLKLRKDSNLDFDKIFEASRLMEFAVLSDKDIKRKYSSKVSLWKRGLSM